MGSVSNISQKISQYQNSGLNYVGQKLGTPSINRLAINARTDSTVLKIVKLVATITLLPVVALALYDFAQRLWTVIVGKMPQPAPQNLNQPAQPAQPSNSAPAAVDPRVPAAPVQLLVQEVVRQSSDQADEAAAAAQQARARAEADAAAAAELAAAQEQAAREAEQLARQEQERLAAQAAAAAASLLQAQQAQAAAQVTAPSAEVSSTEAANASAAAAEAERLQQEVAQSKVEMEALAQKIDTKTALALDAAVVAQTHAERAEEARQVAEQPAPLTGAQVAAVQAGAVVITDVIEQPAAPVAAPVAPSSVDEETDAAIAALNAQLGDFEEPSLTVPTDSAAAAPSLEAVMAEEHSETTSFADTTSSHSQPEFYEYKTPGTQSSDNSAAVEDVSEHKEPAAAPAKRRHSRRGHGNSSGTHAPRNRISMSGSVTSKRVSPQGSPSNRKDQ